MSKVAKHKNQAQHNENFYEKIRQDSFTDWAATGLFYAALHYIEGYLESKGIRVGNHKERAKWVNIEKQLKSLYPHYRILYDISVNARYKFHRLTKTDLSRLYSDDYQPIKTHLLSLY